MRSCAIHVHKDSVEAMLLQQCSEVTMVILSITLWLPTYMGQSLIRCNIPVGHFGNAWQINFVVIGFGPAEMRWLG